MGVAVLPALATNSISKRDINIQLRKGPQHPIRSNAILNDLPQVFFSFTAPTLWRRQASTGKRNHKKTRKWSSIQTQPRQLEKPLTEAVLLDMASQLPLAQLRELTQLFESMDKDTVPLPNLVNS